MNKMIKKITLSVSALAMLLLPVAVPVAVSAQANIQQNLDKGTCLSTTTTDCDTQDPETTVNDIIATVINLFSLLVGVVSVIMIIIGGFKYITSGGNDGSVSEAKKTILFALVGLVIVALAQVIVRFVLAQATEV